MIFMVLTPRAWNRVKGALRKRWPAVRSSQMDTALGKAVGFASYYEALACIRSPDSPLVRPFRQEALTSHLTSLGYEVKLEKSEEALFDQLGIPIAAAFRDREGEVRWEHASSPTSCGCPMPNWPNSRRWASPSSAQPMLWKLRMNGRLIRQACRGSRRAV